MFIVIVTVSLITSVMVIITSCIGAMSDIKHGGVVDAIAVVGVGGVVGLKKLIS
jgi:hypothetical protein